jgi:hypothetical protein
MRSKSSRHPIVLEIIVRDCFEKVYDDCLCHWGYTIFWLHCFRCLSAHVAVYTLHGVTVEGLDDERVDETEDGDGKQHGKDGAHNAGARKVASKVGHALGNQVYNGFDALLHNGGHVLVDLQGGQERDESRAADDGAKLGEEGHYVHGCVLLGHCFYSGETFFTLSDWNFCLDIPHMDTILCLTPIVGFIEQVVGRIVRIAEHKSVPLIIDVVDNVGLFAGMARTRNRWYKTVKVEDVSDCHVDSNSPYETVKPSLIISEWLNEQDPWNK